MLRRRLLLVCLALTVVDLGLLEALHVTTGRRSLSFLVWNLFLAWVPFVAAFALDRTQARRPVVRWSLLAVWLAFFPNAPYLVTDLLHIHPYRGRLLGSLALLGATPVGVALGLSSLLLVERGLRDRYGERTALVVSVTFIAAACAGIYLGRVQRLNSWDLVAHPSTIVGASWAAVVEPRPIASAAAIALGGFLTMLYLPLRRAVSSGQR